MTASPTAFLVMCGTMALFLPAGTAAQGAAPGTAGQTFVRVSPRDARYFELSDGTPYVPTGLNMVQPPYPHKEFGEMAGWIERLSAHGGNFIRVWLGAHYFDVEHEKSGRYDEAQAEHIDELLAICRKRGVRV